MHHEIDLSSCIQGGECAISLTLHEVFVWGGSASDWRGCPCTCQGYEAAGNDWVSDRKMCPPRLLTQIHLIIHRDFAAHTKLSALFLFLTHSQKLRNPKVFQHEPLLPRAIGSPFLPLAHPNPTNCPLWQVESCLQKRSSP
jgi:hypothetical protein